MALASATALSWRPLPPRPSSSLPLAVNGARIPAISASLPRAPLPRGTRWSSSSGCGNFMLEKSLCSPFMDIRLKLFSSSKRERRGRSGGHGSAVVTRAGMRLDPGGGRNNDGGIGRVIVNLALAGGVTYLALTGKLGWVFDTLVSLWLLAVLVPIVSFVAFLWFAEREIVKGACPNCGQPFQVFEFAVKEQPNLCPYCSQPFKLDNAKQFVRDEPRFSNERSGGFRDAFGGFGRDTSSKKEDPGGVVVDVEAEVVDRD
ncbi:unnamed protein product [Calypogeia fissa]